MSQRIAVIGSGVSGLVAAYYLARRHEVVLFEAQDRLGGHVNTVRIGPEFGADAGLPVDTGFIVFNDRTYPHFIRFLSSLGIQGSPTDMSFSYSDLSKDFAYAGTGLSGLFACPRNTFSPGFWAFLAAIPRFNRRALRDLHSGGLEDICLEEYLDRIRAPERLRRDYLGPMTQAIWSAPESKAMAFPASSFLRFFDHHGLLSRPGTVQWRYIQGGSQTYVQAFQNAFPGQIRLNTAVQAVDRPDAGGPVVRQPDGDERFDSVVMAVHADQALDLLADADDLETQALAPWQYSKNRTVLHRDPALMPANRKAWACWNVLRSAADLTSQKVRVTYWMNRLQRLQAKDHWMVSLNPDQKCTPGTKVYETMYEHPVYTMESGAAQKLLPSISGRRQTYFCGSYHGYGFHEDGARSAVDVVHKHFGIST